MYWILFFIVLFATVAMTVAEGVWNNVLLLAYITLGGVVAFGVYQPLTVLADEASGGEYTYMLDMPICWGVFALTVGLLKGLGMGLSRTRVLFPESVENAGGPAVGLLCGLLLGAFAMATMHLAPLPKDSFNGALLPEAPGSAFSAPDRGWLGLVGGMLSAGSLGTGSLEETGYESYWSQDFVVTYADRRERFEGTETSRVPRTGG